MAASKKTAANLRPKPATLKQAPKKAVKQASKKAPKKALKKALKKPLKKHSPADRQVAKARVPKAAASPISPPGEGRVADVLQCLRRDYPDACCALIHRSPFELLVATILSAQCTDERVNQVTPDLFKRFPHPRDFAAAPLAVLERAVQSTGFYRNKAKNIQACCRQLVERYGGETPQDLASLVSLPGVGRKTANVVLGTGFRVASGVVVDTHVGRISRRLGLTVHHDPVKAEQQLMAILPTEAWIDFSHQMIFHGRRVCAARKPRCGECSMQGFCPQIGLA